MKNRICIMDYGLGNVKSIFNAVKKVGGDPYYFSETKDYSFDTLIIPGVGSFNEAMKLINNNYLDLINYAKKNEKLIIGICLGMQIMFEYGLEGKKTKGLGFFKGNVELISKSESHKIPNIGWKKVNILKKNNKNLNIFNLKKFYFIHSFCVHLKKNKKDIIGILKYYDKKIVSIINNKNIYGFQFHPEKSGKDGLKLLKKILN